MTTAVLPRSLEKALKFRRKLAARQPVYGAWSTLGSADVAYLMARAGLDYLIVDLEHGAGSIDGLRAQVLALEHFDTAIIVRLPDHSAGAIKRILDTGASGLLAPCVDDAEQARSIMSSALFAPEGQRGVAVGAITAADYGYEAESYFANANEAITVFLQVESPQAIDNLPEMLKEERVDGFFVGPNDLSAALGVFRDYECDIFQSALHSILSQVKASGKLAGCLPFPGKSSEQLQMEGIALAPGGSDQAFLRNGAMSLLR
ncbi:HpcH/HpaI aldolase family protein [Polycladidibacter hongkongensis]|uniref:HpcH/HpaI aldolase family protein n=1 Tax=Polycladidibacter hongkongensis TaxID=1647556 RepID=UPI00082B6048|nr:aldolase/citrate lyase family protein [Pseudovibrio hongkongensis]